MRSSELAHMAGVSVRTLRHYHAIGLLDEPERSENGYRDYDATHLLRVLRIRQLATLGFLLEQIGPMIDELDAERVEADEPDVGAPTETDRLLAELDEQLARQIEHLQKQRELIAHVRTSQVDPDYPERAAHVLKAIDAFERHANGCGFLLAALTEEDRVAMGIAAHLYSDSELAEIERIFQAIPERGLTEEYLQVSQLMDTLPANAPKAERETAIEAGLAFLDKISDCMDPDNWLHPGKDYDLLLENMAMVHYNNAQIAASDELFVRFTQRLAERASST